MVWKVKKKIYKRKKSMHRNTSLINVAKDKVTKRTKTPTKRASVDCAGEECGTITTTERGRGRDEVKEVKTENTGHGARAEKER